MTGFIFLLKQQISQYMDNLLKIAFNELGEKEIQGSEDNPTIVNYALESGFAWVNDDETPWCSIFINWVAMKAGLTTSKKANARSWLRVGLNVDTEPEPGDIVIFWRDEPESWKGHVGLFLGYSSNLERVYCLGGNQGNQVSVSAYHSDMVLGFRRLRSSEMITLPDPVLKIGDKGTNVKQLQDALKSEGFNCGTSDGDFGPATMKAVKVLQSQKTGITIDGIYGVITRALLFELINK